MRTITQAEFEILPMDKDGYKVCPTGYYPEIDYSGKCKFDDFCRFGVKCVFSADCYFGSQCSFSNLCTFGAQCKFGQGCSFEELCTFGRGCIFDSACNFNRKCRFMGTCVFGDRCAFEESQFIDESPKFGAHCSLIGYCDFEGYPNAVCFSCCSGEEEKGTIYFFWSKDGTFVIADQFYRSIEDFQYDEEKQRKTPLTEYTFAAGELAKKYFNMIYSNRRNEI